MFAPRCRQLDSSKKTLSRRFSKRISDNLHSQTISNLHQNSSISIKKPPHKINKTTCSFDKTSTKINKTLDKSEHIDQKPKLNHQIFSSFFRKNSNSSINQLTVLKKKKLQQKNLNLLLDNRKHQSLISLKLPSSNPSTHKIAELIRKQKSRPSPSKTYKANLFYKKNSCPNIITNNLKKTASEIIKKGPFLKKLLKVPCKSESKLLRQNKRLVNKTNISGFSNIKTKPIEKTNKTFDFPSKDEEKLYDIINQEYQTLFNVKTTKSLQNNILPNIEDYLKTVKNFRSEKLKQKSEKIQVKCSEISKRLEKNLHLLKINFDQKKNQQIELKKENACQKIQKTWRNYRQKHQKTFKNVLNICHTSLYQKNRAKLLQKRVFSPSTLKKNLLENRKSLEKKFLTSKNVLLNKNDSHTLKLSHKWKDLRENNHKLIPKLKIDVTKLRLSRNNIESLRLSQNLDSFSSSKIKHSINTTLNFKEINENSKSLITIHDFNSKSIEREDLSKITSSIHEKNNRNPNKSQDVSFEPIMKKDSVYEKIKEENSESHSENEVIKIAEIVDLAELSKQYQDELDLVKENYLKQLNNKEVNQAAEKFFSLIQKQSDLNKRILFENSKLTKAISNIREDSPLTSTFYPNPNSESLPNDPKISVKSNLSDLRAAFGSEKLLKEASSSIGLQNTEKDKEGQKIFEEDSFRNFTNRKILEFLKKENLKEILKIRENPSKRKTRNHDLQKKREKKGFEIEKWVSKENSKQKIKKKSVESLGFDLPKTQRDLALLESFSSARKSLTNVSYREFQSERLKRMNSNQELVENKVRIKKKSFSKKKKVILPNLQENKEPDRINEEPAIIFQTDVNPFQKDLINEFKGKSEKDELYVEEITRNLINEILNEFWTSTFLEKNRVFHKLKHFFLKTPLIVNNEKIAFKMPDDVEISLALFQNKHINELFKYLYNSLIELVLTEWDGYIIDKFNDKNDFYEYLKLKYYSLDNVYENPMTIAQFFKDNFILKDNNLKKYLKKVKKDFIGFDQKILVDCAFLIFTCFNEKLIAFKFLTKENNNRGLSQINTTKFFKKEDFLNILETIKNNFSELIENFCGVLEDNCLFQDLSSEENKEEVIIQIRELNMFKVLQEELYEIDKEWIDYEKEKNQIKIELSEMIFDDLVDEISDFILCKQSVINNK